MTNNLSRFDVNLDLQQTSQWISYSCPFGSDRPIQSELDEDCVKDESQLVKGFYESFYELYVQKSHLAWIAYKDYMLKNDIQIKKTI